MNKYLILGVIFACTFFEIRGQQALTVWAKKFEAYQALWPKTKLHLVFNQDKFSTGDTVWFKTFLLTENMTFVEGKQLIDVNLVDSQGQSKTHFLFAINNGMAENQLVIPNTLAAGFYLITAHSNWMKNFDPTLIFKKEITVVTKNTLARKKRPQLKAAAEGGHLIRDISNKVSVLTYRPGAIVQLIGANGQEINRTTTDGNGIGSVSFIPVRSASYFVRIVGDSLRVPLAVTEDDGCSLLLVSAEGHAPVRLEIASPSGSPLRHEELTVVVTSRGKICHTAIFVLETKEFVSLEIPQDNLPEGIAHISLLDHGGRLLASRDFYNPGSLHAEANIQPARNSFQTGEHVKLDVVITESNGHPVEGQFAISVVNAALFDPIQQNSIGDELNIMSELKERCLIDRSDKNWMINLDNYLIHFTEAVPWQEILSSNPPKPRFGFSSTLQKNGKAYFAGTHKPVDDHTQLMFYLQRDKWRYQTFTLDSGRFRLTLPDIIGQDEFFYLAETKKEKEILNLGIAWDDESVVLPRAALSDEVERDDPYASFVAKSRLIDQAYGLDVSPQATGTGGGMLTTASHVEDKTLTPDITVNVQEYVLFHTMEELVKEVIPSLFHRKSGGKSIVRVILPEPMMAMETGDPLYFIDGIATKNTAFFLSLKPSELLTVKIVKDPRKLARYGLMGKNGIVIVQTKNGNTRESLDPSKLVDGLNKSLAFNTHDLPPAPRHSKPDFRTTIYWNPSVKTDSAGKATAAFFCTDDVGKLKVRIDGITIDGQPFSSALTLEVKPRKN
jgi:hypothetical protein